MLHIQVYRIDAVTAEEVDSGHFQGEPVDTGGECEDLVGGILHQEVSVCEGQHKGVQLKEPEDGVGRPHWDVQDERTS